MINQKNNQYVRCLMRICRACFSERYLTKGTLMFVISYGLVFLTSWTGLHGVAIKNRYRNVLDTNYSSVLYCTFLTKLFVEVLIF